MENEQIAEVAPVQSEPVVEAPKTEVSAVLPEVKKEVVSTEPRHPLQDILDKAAKKAEANKAVPKEENKEGLAAPAAPEVFDLSKWDGNALTLPDKIKKIVTDNQVAFHEKAKEAAELKAQYEALQGMVNNYAQQIAQPDPAQPLFTKEEFEQAQLDPNKFLDLTTRVAQHIVDQKAQGLEPLISQIQFNQQVTENEKAINDFAGKHQDFWQLYDAGILEPLVTKHGLEQGYNLAAKAKANLMQEAINLSQNRVQQKKASIAAVPTQAQSIEVTYVDRPEDALPTAARFAAEGKKVKVKLRK